jgi:hypothetical protein
MQKLSETLIDALDEMEFLNKILHSAFLHHHSQQNLSSIIKKSQHHLAEATLDFAIDIDHKINRHKNKEHFIENCLKHLKLASTNLKLIPEQKDVINFNEAEKQIIHIASFIKDYSTHSNNLIRQMDKREIEKLNQKIAIIRGKRLTI